MSKKDNKYPSIDDYLGWGVPVWQEAIIFWDDYLGDHYSHANKLGLEIGANNGGLSLYLASRYHVQMVCSDIKEPNQLTFKLHEKFNDAHRITYAAINALEIPYRENYFDFVILKSVLVTIGSYNQIENMRKAVKEIYRVLKPGGVIFFAENLEGSPLHKLARILFVPWGRKCKYFTVQELKDVLHSFSEVNYKTFGFLIPFFQNQRIGQLLRPLDKGLNIILPQNYQYLIYGYAIK